MRTLRMLSFLVVVLAAAVLLGECDDWRRCCSSRQYLIAAQNGGNETRSRWFHPALAAAGTDRRHRPYGQHCSGRREERPFSRPNSRTFLAMGKR